MKNELAKEKQYYKICLRHMRKNDNVFIFWGVNNGGYIKSIEDAGLYKNEDIDFKTQVKNGDFLIHKDIIKKLAKKVRLPIYGDKIETYSNRNEFLVLPNTGQIRKELGITILDIKMDNSNNSFNAYFEETIKEKLKIQYSKTHYQVKGKEEYFDEYWFYDTQVEAESRNKAINKVYESGDFGLCKLDCSFIEFKKKVTCSRAKEVVFDKWVSTFITN